MEWVDDTVAIGNWQDLRRHGQLLLNDIDLTMDARNVFRQRFFYIGRLPVAERVNRAVELLLLLSEKRAKVLVHCYHGRDRSPFLTMVYLSRKLGIGYEDAFEIVQRGRPRAKYHPEWVDALRRSGHADVPSSDK